MFFRGRRLMKLEDPCTAVSAIQSAIDSTNSRVGTILLEFISMHDCIIECLQLQIIFYSQYNDLKSQMQFHSFDGIGLKKIKEELNSTISFQIEMMFQQNTDKYVVSFYQYKLFKYHAMMLYSLKKGRLLQKHLNLDFNGE